MSANPFLGVLLHAIGGLAAASFYIPYKRVKGWAWENYWLAGGIFSWVVAPIALALLIVPATPEVLMAAPARALGFTFLFGVLWGVGGLTFGLSMRYLGIALGYAIALGLCAAFGTLIPPLVSGELISTARETSGQIMLGGVGLCLLGIAFSGVAGISKERELPEDQKTEAISEFSFAKGLTVAIFSGIMSASMAYAFQAGKPISEAALAAGAPELWQNLPVLIIAFLGGLTTNAVWCLILMVRNGTMGDYTRAVVDGERVPLLANYVLCALAGVTWYLQFFFYSMGTTQMGRYDFSSWTIHMAAIITFSTLWGIALREWRGTSRRTHAWIAIGLAVLILSTVVIGYGNYLAAKA
ncbi:MAG: L-rhamnose/proton symporter RhaT [Armatimonadetes bacterium]|jgi:L-rhamnose-H+ transport protein|nr:L-rhamnose/proton symporter RhaT [Armatimonadota bacterium]MDI9603113.1 L-rhamnose/proton symporter RhaT [Acidobacteriota bacterium]